METYFQNPFGAAAPRIERIEEDVNRVLRDLHRVGDAYTGEARYDVSLERLKVYGTQAVMANRSFVLLWRKNVPKTLLKDAAFFPEWSEEDWGFFVAAVKMGPGAPFFYVVSVHGDAELAIQELVARASTQMAEHEMARLAA